MSVLTRAFLLALTIFVALRSPNAFAKLTVAELEDGTTLSLDMQYRPRFQTNTGRDFADLDGASPWYVSHRAAVGVGLVNEGGLAAYVRVVDVRHWGEEAVDGKPDLHGTFDSRAEGVDFHEAYGIIPLGVEGLRLKIGRQEITWDNGRLIGNANFSQGARNFDAARLIWRSCDRFEAEGLYAKIREADASRDGRPPAGRDDDIDLAGTHLTWQYVNGHRLSLLYLLKKDHGTADETRHTAGAFAAGNAGGFAYSAEGFYQGGTAGDQSLGAYLAAVKLGYGLSMAPKPTLTLHAELLSGDGTKAGTFDNLYASNHGKYGEMDFFTVIPKHTANLGLMDLGGRLAVAPHKAFKAHVDVHLLQSVEDAAGGSKDFGLEVDTKLVWAPWRGVKISALYGVFLPGEAMRAPHFSSLEDIHEDNALTADLETEHFGYLMTDVSF